MAGQEHRLLAALHDLGAATCSTGLWHRLAARLAPVGPLDASSPWSSSPLHRTVVTSTEVPSACLAEARVTGRRPALLSLRHPGVHSRPVAPRGGRAFGGSVPSDPIVFRPRGLSPPRRLAPPGLCGLVASRCRSWGSPRFGTAPTSGAPPGSVEPSSLPSVEDDPSPRRGSDPSKEATRRQPHPVTRAVASLALQLLPMTRHPEGWRRPHDPKTARPWLVCRHRRRCREPSRARLRDPRSRGPARRVDVLPDGAPSRATGSSRVRADPCSVPPRRHLTTPRGRVQATDRSVCAPPGRVRESLEGRWVRPSPSVPTSELACSRRCAGALRPTGRDPARRHPTEAVCRPTRSVCAADCTYVASGLPSRATARPRGVGPVRSTWPRRLGTPSSVASHRLPAPEGTGAAPRTPLTLAGRARRSTVADSRRPGIRRSRRWARACSPAGEPHRLVLPEGIAPAPPRWAGPVHAAVPVASWPAAAPESASPTRGPGRPSSSSSPMRAPAGVVRPKTSSPTARPSPCCLDPPPAGRRAVPVSTEMETASRATRIAVDAPSTAPTGSVRGSAGQACAPADAGPRGRAGERDVRVATAIRRPPPRAPTPRGRPPARPRRGSAGARRPPLSR